MVFVQCWKPWMGGDMQQIFYTCHELKMSWNTVLFCNCDEPEICTCNLGIERAALLYVSM